jgi:hypothetical protein
MPRCLFALVLLVVLPTLSGCDTDNPSTPLEEIEGVYVFTEFLFDTDASAIADADVLARLDSARSNVELFGSGRALIRFKLDDEPSQLADANATATSASVRLTAETQDDAVVLSQILLPPTMTFERGTTDERLTGEFFLAAADLEAFDPETYAGVPPVSGTLYVTLDREDDGGR